MKLQVTLRKTTFTDHDLELDDEELDRRVEPRYQAYLAERTAAGYVFADPEYFRRYFKRLELRRMAEEALERAGFRLGISEDGDTSLLIQRTDPITEGS